MLYYYDINKLVVKDKKNDPNLIVWDGEKEGKEKEKEVNVNRSNWEALLLNITKKEVEKK